MVVSHRSPGVLPLVLDLKQACPTVDGIVELCLVGNVAEETKYRMRWNRPAGHGLQIAE